MPIPRSLGFITVPTPGTPVPLASSGLLVASARLQPRSAPTVVNVGNVYIGTQGMNKTTGSGVYAVLSPEQVEGFQLGPYVDVAQIFLDADNAGDGVLAAYLI